MKDKIFLLSVEEFNAYVRDKKFARIKMTKYDTVERIWWLRSPGDRANSAAGVNDYGFVCYDGDDVYEYSFAVCPAFQVTQEEFKVLPITKKGFIKYCGVKCRVLTKDYNGNVLLFAKRPIAIRRFDPNKNDYEASEIRKFLLDWYEEHKNE